MCVNWNELAGGDSPKYPRGERKKWGLSHPEWMRHSNYSHVCPYKMPMTQTCTNPRSAHTTEDVVVNTTRRWHENDNWWLTAAGSGTTWIHNLQIRTFLVYSTVQTADPHCVHPGDLNRQWFIHTCSNSSDVMIKSEALSIICGKQHVTLCVGGKAAIPLLLCNVATYFRKQQKDTHHLLSLFVAERSTIKQSSHQHTLPLRFLLSTYYVPNNIILYSKVLISYQA